MYSRVDRERPYLGEGRLQVWLELAVGAGIDLPEQLEARRQRWRELAVSSGDESDGGVRVRSDQAPEREEGPRP